MNNTENPRIPARWVAEIWLVVLTVFWGSSFASIKVALEGTSSVTLLAYRFSFASFVILLVRPKVLSQLTSIGFRYGFLLSLILFFGYGLQTIGMNYTSASRSAFVTCLHATFVPFFWIILAKKRPERNNLIGLGIAVIGLYFLLVKPGEPLIGATFTGDVLTFLCAIAWALYIVVLPMCSCKTDLAPLMFGQVFGMAVLCWTAVLFRGQTPVASSQSMGLILYLAACCTLIPVFLQTKYQQYTTSPRAAVIYTLEPVCAASLAFFFLGETMVAREFLGAGLILGGVLVSELL